MDRGRRIGVLLGQSDLALAGLYAPRRRCLGRHRGAASSIRNPGYSYVSEGLSDGGRLLDIQAILMGERAALAFAYLGFDGARQAHSCRAKGHRSHVGMWRDNFVFARLLRLFRSFSAGSPAAAV